MNILIEKLKKVVKERRDEGISENALINAVKEELQYPILDFIYNNRAYSHLVMYGGTLLRIAYGLSRMSEDLDFQTDKTFDFKKFKNDLIAYFKKTYDVEVEMDYKTERLTGTDMATIKFLNVLQDLGIHGHGVPTVLKIRVDVNFFSCTSDFLPETIPKVKDTFAFTIKTYSFSTLMASKIAAILLRTTRGIGVETSACKPRDIYDLIWYMDKKILPDIEYLKKIFKRIGMEMKARNVLKVFDLLKRHVLNLDDNLFKHDLAPFFYSPNEYDEWYRNWKQRFRMLVDSYEIYEIKKKDGNPDLLEIVMTRGSSNNNRYFHFYFSTSAFGRLNNRAKFTFALSENWYIFSEYKIGSGYRKKNIEPLIKSAYKLSDLDYQYVGLFYTKIADYLKRNDYIVLHSELETKLIRATADKLNVKTQVFLDRRLLIKERLEDLLSLNI